MGQQRALIVDRRPRPQQILRISEIRPQKPLDGIMLGPGHELIREYDSCWSRGRMKLSELITKLEGIDG